MKTFAVVASLILQEFIDFIWSKIQLIKGQEHWSSGYGGCEFESRYQILFTLLCCIIVVFTYEREAGDDT